MLGLRRQRRPFRNHARAITNGRTHAMRRSIQSVRRLLSRRQSGIAALEFGLLAPVFLIVLAGTVDIGSALYTRISLEAAIAAGADYALVHAGMVNSASGQALASNIATMVTTAGVVVVN